MTFFKTIPIPIMCFAFTITTAKTIYVSVSGVDANTGNAWNQSFKTVQKAIAVAVSGDEIWVAKGTYYPDEGNGSPNNDRSLSFNLKNGVKIYGGFAGTETSITQRNWVTNASILSGEIQQDANSTNNSYHVVVSVNTNANTTVDGFTIKEGNANGESDIIGGGWLNMGYKIDNVSFLSNPTIVNCNFTGNRAVNGGAIFNLGTEGTSNPNISKCSFIGNYGKEAGGSIFNYGSQGNASPKITDCTFINNTTFGDGGAICNNGINGISSPIITNCVFRGNVALYGGAIFNNGEVEGSIANPNITNCSFVNNESGTFGTIFNNVNGTAQITNCIFWKNGSPQIYPSGSGIVKNSIIEGGYVGIGNLNIDPLFVNAAIGDLHLQPCSPAIDAGNNTEVVVNTDLDGNPRIVNSKVDMGAYESQTGSCCTAANVIYVNKAATGQNNGSSWVNAFTVLQDALAKTGSCENINQVWVAKGTYYTDEGNGLANNDRSLSFKLKNGIALYGGFVGTESSLSQRNGKTNITILSGEIQQDNIKTNNAYYVVRAEGSAITILDGFTISGGTE